MRDWFTSVDITNVPESYPTAEEAMREVLPRLKRGEIRLYPQPLLLPPDADPADWRDVLTAMLLEMGY